MGMHPADVIAIGAFQGVSVENDFLVQPFLQVGITEQVFIIGQAEVQPNPTHKAVVFHQVVHPDLKENIESRVEVYWPPASGKRLIAVIDVIAPNELPFVVARLTRYLVRYTQWQP